MKYKIYRLIKDDKTVYVGRTKQRYLYDRAKTHRRDKRDFNSYELIEFTEDPTREKYWINHYDTFNNGFNLTEDGLGGEGGIKRKPIRVFNDAGFDKEYPSIIEAARQLSLSSGNLSSVCKGRYKQTKGYKAEYIMEVI